LGFVAKCGVVSVLYVVVCGRPSSADVGRDLVFFPLSKNIYHKHTSATKPTSSSSIHDRLFAFTRGMVATTGTKDHILT
jgi:hypothetical protein